MRRGIVGRVRSRHPPCFHRLPTLRGRPIQPACPRFVSLKTEGVEGRHGPGLEHRVDWIYERAGLPVQVLAESGAWRRVRDPDGAEVWMHAQNLDARRTVYVREPATLRRTARAGGASRRLSACPASSARSPAAKANGGASLSAAASAGCENARSGAAIAPGL